MNNYLDIRSLALMMGVVSMTLAVGMVYLQAYHKTYRGFAFWSVGAVCAAIGGILLCMRGYVPQLLSIVVANTLLVLFLTCVSLGAERFSGKKTTHWPDTIVLFLFIGGMLYFTYKIPGIEERIVLVSLTFCYFSGKSIWLLKHGDPELQHTFLQATLWLTAIWFLIRAAVTIASPLDLTDFMQAGLFQAVALVVYIINHILLTIGLILANHQKLESDLRSSNRSLKESEEHFHTLSDASFEGIILTEGQKILDVNQALLDISGYRKEEMIGMSFMDFLAPEVRKEVLSRIISGHEQPYETIAVKKDGTTLPIEAHGKQITYKGREVRVAAIRDLSEQKKSQALLKESEQRLIEAQRIAKVGHYILDIQSGCWKSSTELDNLFGINDGYPKDIEGWKAIIHPEHQEEMVRYLSDHVLGQHHKFDKEYKIVNQSNQKEYWVHGIGDLKFDDNGNLFEMIGTIQDITERRKLEKDLRTSQQNMATVLNNTKDGIIRIDKDFKRIYANPAVYRDTGLSEEQYLGKTCSEIGFPEKLCALWQEKYERVFSTGRPETFEFTITPTNGVERVFQANVSPEFNRTGEVETIISIMRDITDIKRAESEKNIVIADLEKALAEVKVLRGFIPICSHCKSIRDDKGLWNNMEAYIEKHSEALFSHGLCTKCADELYGNEDWYQNQTEPSDS